MVTNAFTLISSCLVLSVILEEQWWYCSLNKNQIAVRSEFRRGLRRTIFYIGRNIASFQRQGKLENFNSILNVFVIIEKLTSNLSLIYWTRTLLALTALLVILM